MHGFKYVCYRKTCKNLIAWLCEKVERSDVCMFLSIFVPIAVLTFFSFLGHRLHGSNLSITVVGSNLECVHLCLFDPKCASLNYRKRASLASHVCELNSKTKTSNPTKFVSDQNCNYYEPILPVS